MPPRAHAGHRTPVEPAAVPIRVLRLGRHGAPPSGVGHAHSHDFLVVAYVERGGERLRIGSREWTVEPGDAFVIAPPEVVVLGGEGSARPPDAQGWAVFFPPEVLGGADARSLLGWHTHPLLFPFVRGASGGAQHLRVPSAARGTWSGRMAALDRELTGRQEGHVEAARAHLTLLLIDLARLAREAAPAEALAHDELLARVFTVIEDGYAGPLTLADVAEAVGLTPEYLTTVVRRRTGRTVGTWITERRLTQARALLAGAELSVAQVALRSGFADPAYFTRVFRRAHGMPPRLWRREATGTEERGGRRPPAGQTPERFTSEWAARSR